VLDDGNGRPAADRELLVRAAIRSWRDSLVSLPAASRRLTADAVYRDLRDHEELIAAHPVVKALAAGGLVREAGYLPAPGAAGTGTDAPGHGVAPSAGAGTAGTAAGAPGPGVAGSARAGAAGNGPSRIRTAGAEALWAGPSGAGTARARTAGEGTAGEGRAWAGASGAGTGAPGADTDRGGAPLDADSAQRACVAAVLAGRPAVVDGPARQGRNQVVVKIVGALLEVGKTVLVAADEAAGPGPLRKQLAAAGLGGYLRELRVGPAGRHAAGGTPAGAAREAPGEAAGGLPGAGAGASGAVPGEVRRAAAALAAAWRPAVEGRSFHWRGVIEHGSLDDRLYQAASALEALGAMVRPNEALAAVAGLTRPSDAEALAGLLGHLWGWPDGLPDEWLTTDTLDAVDAAVAQLAAALMAIAARESQAAKATGGSWQEIPEPDVSPVADMKALAALSPPGADVAGMTPGQISGLAQAFAAGADMLEKRLGTLSGLASMLGLRPPVTFHDVADLLTLARLAQEPDRPERAWLSIPGHQAASRAARVLYDAHRALASAEAQAATIFTPRVLQLDVDGLAERLGAHRGIGRLSGEHRADRKAVADATRGDVDPATAQEYFGLAVTWKHAAQELAAAESSYAALLGSYYIGAGTDFDQLSRALATAATAVRCARRQDLSQAADHLCRDAVPKPVITATAAEILRDVSGWQATLAAPPAVAPRPELMNGTISEAIGWLRAHLAPLRAASEFTAQLSELAGRQLSFGEARQLVALREAAEAAHAELAARDAVFKDLCGPLYAGTDTDLTALRAALEWARKLRANITRGPGPLAPAHVRAAESAVPSPRLEEAAAAWRQASAGLLAAFTPARGRELAAELDDYRRGIQILEALFNDAAGRDEWHAYQAARATLAAHGLDEAVERCVAERVAAAQVPQLIEQAFASRGLPVRTGGEAGPAAVAGRPCLVSTPLAVSQQLPAAAAFDVVVIDDAGRVSAAAAAGCIYRGATLVLAGDSSEPRPPGTVSLLELAGRSGAFHTVRLP